MKASRLKTIVIVILLLVNAFLLFLLLSRRAEQNAAYERTVDQLISLYEASGIALERSVLPQDSDLFSAETQREESREAAFAAALLGSVTASDVGGAEHYSGEYGSCTFRSGGAVEASLARDVSDIDAFCDELFKSFGYTRTGAPLAADSGSVTGLRSADGRCVFNAPLTLTFSSGSLVSVSGTFLSTLSGGRRTEGVDAVSALVFFLDHRNTSGIVCTQITAMESGYLLQPTAAAQTAAVPVWRVTTDVNSYYVNALTGEVTRE